MKILALESTGKPVSAALLEDAALLGETTLSRPALSHSETLLPMAEALLRYQGLTFDDIDLFAVSEGPGSFTGVRIGASLLKGLAFGRGKPCLGVSSLEAMATAAAMAGALLCPVLDARRNQVYCALFSLTEGAVTRLTEDRALSLEELAEEILRDHASLPVCLMGDGAEKATAFFRERGIPLLPPPAPLALQNAFGVGLAAFLRLSAGEEPTDDRTLRPTYLRVPQAERDRLKAEASH